MNRDRHKPHNQSGDLLVSGKNYIEIRLDDNPIRVIVKFKHKRHHHPCNPTPEDELSYSIIANDEQFFLFINWNVSGVEEIAWKVYYRRDEDYDADDFAKGDD